MNLQAIIAQAKTQRNHQGNRMFAQQEILRGVSGELKKHEQKADTAFNFIIPKQLQLSFHPTDINDDFFNKENPFVFRGVVDESVIALKRLMREDAELHKQYAMLGGLTVEEYDVSEDIYTKQDMDIFNPMCYPYQPSLPTIKVTTKDAGKFGMTRLSPLEFDDNGQCTTQDFLLWQLHLLESAIVAQNVGEYLLDKDKSKLDEDQKTTLKNKRKGNKIGWQKRSAYLIYIELPMDIDAERVTDDALKAKIEDCVFYMKFNGDEMKKVLKKRGKKKDIYPNFWDMQVVYGDGKPSGDETPEIALYKSREYELISAKVLGEGEKLEPNSIFELRKNFKEDVNKFLADNMEHNFEALAKKTIWDFKPWTDEALLAVYNSRVEEIAKYVSEPIFDQFVGIMDKANAKATSELKAKRKAGKLCIDYTKAANLVIDVEENEITMIETVDDDIEEDGVDMGDLVK